MKKVLIVLGITALVSCILAGGIYIYSKVKPDESATEEASINEENAQEELDKMEDEIKQKDAELDEAIEELENAQLQEDTSNEEVVVTEGTTYEDAYINELEDELDYYYDLYYEALVLAQETEALIDEYNVALAATEEFYDEVTEDVQSAIDNAENYAEEIEDKFDVYQSTIDEVKQQYDSLQHLVDSRKEVLTAEQDGKIKSKAKAYSQYFESLKSELPEIKKYQDVQYVQEFINGYYAQMPDYLAGEGLSAILSSYGASFSVPSFDSNSLKIQIPNLVK
ncbi:MAG: hypothetical protein ABIE03_02880 [Patescibacteria group bacterium]|nr:hypothetical protein [Patescibacteria group bacterium]